MYTFVKIKNTFNGLNIVYNYALEARSIEDIIDHTNKYLHPQIKDGIQDYFMGPQKHAKTMWRKLTEDIARIREISVMDSSIHMENTVIQGKVSALLQFGKIYINKNCSYFVPSESMVVIDSVEKETLDYPDVQLTEKDIKITKWPKGIHWYIRVGGIDVREDDGTNKWISYDRAMEVAKNYLSKLKGGN